MNGDGKVNGLREILGRVSRRALVLCALLIMTMGGGVLLYKHAPHSNLGPILFLLGIFLVLPLTIGEFGGMPANAADKEDDAPFVYGSIDLRTNPLQQGVDDRPMWDDL